MFYQILKFECNFTKEILGIVINYSEYVTQTHLTHSEATDENTTAGCDKALPVVQWGGEMRSCTLSSKPAWRRREGGKEKGREEGKE